MGFSAIFEFIMQIWECIKERKGEVDPANAVKEDLGDPKKRHYRLIVRTLRNEDSLHGRELREEADEMFAMLCEADAEDINDLVDDAIRIGMEAGK